MAGERRHFHEATSTIGSILGLDYNYNVCYLFLANVTDGRCIGIELQSTYL